MKRINLMLAVTLLLYGFCACGQPGSVPPKTGDLKLFRKELSSYRDILQLPGMAVAVIKDSRMVYRQVEGYANLEKKVPLTDNYMFQIASVTKTFTANLMMQYEQEHKASIEDYALNYRFINTYFGWPYNVDANTRIRHFLSHTSEDGRVILSFTTDSASIIFMVSSKQQANMHLLLMAIPLSSKRGSSNPCIWNIR